MAKSEPIFNAPRIVLITIAVLAGVHGIREFVLEPERDEYLLLAAAFIPARYGSEGLPGGEIAKVTSFLTHALLHGDFTHLLVNCGWLLAFGSIVARRLDAVRFLMLSALSAMAGALLFLAMNWGLAQPMVGASGAISGLMGAAIRFMFLPEPPSWAGGGRSRRSMSLGELARDPRSRMMIGSWLALNLIFGLFLGQLLTSGGIAWEAHLGGFFAGLLAFPAFDQSGGARTPANDDHSAEI